MTYLTVMLRSTAIDAPISVDRPFPVGPVAYFKTRNRYRDIVMAPDGVRIFVVTDTEGRTVGPSGALVRDLVNPGSLLEFR